MYKDKQKERLKMIKWDKANNEVLSIKNKIYCLKYKLTNAKTIKEKLTFEKQIEALKERRAKLNAIKDKIKFESNEIEKKLKKEFSINEIKTVENYHRKHIIELNETRNVQLQQKYGTTDKLAIHKNVIDLIQNTLVRIGA